MSGQQPRPSKPIIPRRPDAMPIPETAKRARTPKNIIRQPVKQLPMRKIKEEGENIVEDLAEPLTCDECGDDLSAGYCESCTLAGR